MTGELGGSEAGRLLLAARRPARDDPLVRRHLRPEPRLRAGRALAAAGASAMIDLSDGLATDARHLAERSGVELRLRLARRARSRPASRAVADDPRAFAAAGGDDYELLVTVPPERRAARPARRAADLARRGRGAAEASSSRAQKVSQCGASRIRAPLSASIASATAAASTT